LVKVLIIYSAKSNRSIPVAEKIKNRLESIGLEVQMFSDKQFKHSRATIEDQDVLVIGAACLECEACLGAGDCRASDNIEKKLENVLGMDLVGKKLITFASAANPEKTRLITEQVEKAMKTTGITVLLSIGYMNDESSDFDAFLETALEEPMFE
jgi:flavodoxin